MGFWNREKPSTEAEFDIEGMDVFSIRRCDDGDTAFGYTLSGEPEEEWYTSTTDDQHRAFVARLTAKLARQQQKKESE